MASNTVPPTIVNEDMETPSLRLLFEILRIQVSANTIRERMMGQVACRRMAGLDLFQPRLEARAGAGLGLGAA
jgi:hypothetical protein